MPPLAQRPLLLVLGSHHFFSLHHLHQRINRKGRLSRTPFLPPRRAEICRRTCLLGRAVETEREARHSCCCCAAGEFEDCGDAKAPPCASEGTMRTTRTSWQSRARISAGEAYTQDSSVALTSIYSLTCAWPSEARGPQAGRGWTLAGGPGGDMPARGTLHTQAGSSPGQLPSHAVASSHHQSRGLQRQERARRARGRWDSQ